MTSVTRAVGKLQTNPHLAQTTGLWQERRWVPKRVGNLEIGTQLGNPVPVKYASTPQTAYDRMMVRAAGEPDPILAQAWVSKANYARNWPIPEFPLKGRDLKAAGVKDGPEMGKILRALKELWIRSGFEADREKLMTALGMIHPKLR